jgi:alanyl-tRNA synthetase
MQSVVKRVSMLSLSAIVAIAVLFVGCRVIKVVQCNKITKVAHQEAPSIQEFANPAKFQNPKKAAQSFTEIGDKLEKMTKDMQALEIQDAKLKGFQTRFVNMYEETNSGLRDAVTSLEEQDLFGFADSLEKIAKVPSQETSLLQEFNGYCSGNSSSGITVNINFN